MAIEKNEIPILEYDKDSAEIVSPEEEYETKICMPEKCLFLLAQDYWVEAYADVYHGKKICEVKSINGLTPIWKLKNKTGEDICMCQAPLGAPAAASLLDYLIYGGCRKIIAMGSCGAIWDIPENDVLIPVKAMRDEGTSYQYLPAERYIEMDPDAVSVIEKTFTRLGQKYRECVTWTTDGFYRETKDMVQYRRDEGCTAVEMECSALIACARKRGAKFGQFLYTADKLDEGTHDPRNWGKGSVMAAIGLCMEISSDWN